MASLKAGAGYLLIDHSNSPGLTAEQLAHMPGAPVVGKGKIGEWDIKVCSHCQREIRLEPLRIRDRGHCPKCHHYVCDHCDTIRVKTGVCTPMAQILDTLQERYTRESGTAGARPTRATAPILLTDA